MANNNTLLYVGLGVVVVYFIATKKTATSTVPVTSLPPGTAPSTAVQSGSLILTGLSSLTNIFNQVKSSQTAAANVSQGYNADGTIQTGNTTQNSINTLPTDTGTPGLSLTIPSSSPDLLASNSSSTYVDPNSADEIDSYFDA
jgi:hypothetical protein